MAHVVLSAAVSTLFNQLSSPAISEVLVLCNVKKELKKLKGTVGTIRDALQDAEEVQSKEQLVQGWLSRLRVVIYTADDLLDEVAVRALQKKVMINGTSLIIKEVQLILSHIAFVFQTTKKVKGIRKYLDDIKDDMDKLKFITPYIQKDQPLPLVRDDRNTHSFVKEEDVVGRKKEREDIVNMLLAKVEGRHRGLSVIVIVGIGGIGKTTLAQVVYNDKRVGQEFDGLLLWSRINYFSNLEEVLMAIIESSGETPRNLGLDQLQKQLQKIIGGKKCLLVLDDVWEENAHNWDGLKTILDCVGSCSKVLVTTRSRKVAKCLNALEPFYELKALSKGSAWSLLEKLAFEEEELIGDSDLELLGREIVQKCGYAPLAVKTIGSLLVKKGKEKKNWLSLANKQLAKAVPFADNKMMQTLKISYDSVPMELKPCFAYCSIFPKGYGFQKDKLVQLWLAQGYIQPYANNNKSFEEVGEEFFLYLAERGFFEDLQETNEHGVRKYTCKMHDLYLDLAKEVTRTECTIIDKITNDLEDTNLLHISLNHKLDVNSSNDCFRLLSSSKALRSLIFHSKELLPPNSLNKLLATFKKLRTLDLSRIGLERIPDSIGELVHLRYLNLSKNESLKLLPKSICKLHHLQTLDLSQCTTLEKLPSKISKLVSLRYLMLEECKELTSLPLGLASLTSLISLDQLVVHHHYGGLRYLAHLDNLCGNLRVKLPAMGRSNYVREDARESNMSRKHRLNGIVLEWCGVDDEAEAVLEVLKPHDNLEYLKLTKYGGVKLPAWVSSHQNIKELNLHNCTMEYIEDRMISNLFFPSLKILTIECMQNLKGWWREVATAGDDGMPRVSSFPCVSKVVIRSCPMLIERMPLFGRIEELELEWVNWKLVIELLIVSINTILYPNGNKLKKLKLKGIEGLGLLPMELIQHLTTLRTLEISNCKSLRWISRRGLAHLASLEELKIRKCGRVNWQSGHSGRVWVTISWGHVRVGPLSGRVSINNFINRFQRDGVDPDARWRVNTSFTDRQYPSHSSLNPLNLVEQSRGQPRRNNACQTNPLAWERRQEKKRRCGRGRRGWARCSDLSKTLKGNNCAPKDDGDSNVLEWDGDPTCAYPHGNFNWGDGNVDNFIMLFINKVVNFAGYDHCRYRLLTKLLNMRQDRWKEVRMILGNEMRDHREVYQCDPQLDELIFNCNFMSIFTDPRYLMEILMMGFIFASRFQIPLVVLLRSIPMLLLSLIARGPTVKPPQTATPSSKQTAWGTKPKSPSSIPPLSTSSLLSSQHNVVSSKPLFSKLSISSLKRNVLSSKPPFLEGILGVYHRNVEKYVDVMPDGHCGFRAIAESLGMGQEEWKRIRKDLSNEVKKNKHIYNKIVLGHDITQMLQRLECEETPAPYTKWFELPDMGHVVATCYQCVFMVIGGATYLPLVATTLTDLISLPICCIAHLELRQHYVSVMLRPAARMPPLHPLWLTNHDPSVDGLHTIYKGLFGA